MWTTILCDHDLFPALLRPKLSFIDIVRLMGTCRQIRAYLRRQNWSAEIWATFRWKLSTVDQVSALIADGNHCIYGCGMRPINPINQQLTRFTSCIQCHKFVLLDSAEDRTRLRRLVAQHFPPHLLDWYCYWWSQQCAFSPLFYKPKEYKERCCVPLYKKPGIHYAVQLDKCTLYICAYIQWVTEYAQQHASDMRDTLTVADSQVNEALDYYYKICAMGPI